MSPQTSSKERKCFFPMRSSSLGEQMPREPRHQRLSEVKHEAKKRPAAQPPASCPSPRGTLSSPISLSISHLFRGAAASSFYYSCTAPHTWCYIKRSGNELREPQRAVQSFASRCERPRSLGTPQGNPWCVGSVAKTHVGHGPKAARWAGGSACQKQHEASQPERKKNKK